MIRPTETIDIETPEADSLDEMYAGLRAQIPEGFELSGLHPSQHRGTARRIGLREVTLESRGDLESSVPDGWQAVSIRQG